MKSTNEEKETKKNRYHEICVIDGIHIVKVANKLQQKPSHAHHIRQYTRITIELWATYEAENTNENDNENENRNENEKNLNQQQTNQRWTHKSLESICLVSHCVHAISIIVAHPS